MNDRGILGFWREIELRQSRHRFEWSDSRVPDFPVCVRCSTLLERHQPDGARPDSILGTCGECGAWYLIDEEHREVHGLPDLQSLRREKRD